VDIIPFGSSVRDEITEFEGAVICRVEHINGCIRYEIQPIIDKEGKLPESKMFDALSLKIITRSKDSSSTIKTNKFDLGVKVEDVLSGYGGVAVIRIKHRHSGDRYGVQARMNEKGEVPDIKTFDEEDLEQIYPPVPKIKKKKDEPPSGPHGHNDRFER
jgi:hypothetical protein